MAAPIETKVSWSTLAATVLTGLVFAANHTSLIDGYDDWPAWAKAIVSVVVIAGGTFGAGFAAPHTSRFGSDPGTAAARAAHDEKLAPGNVTKVSKVSGTIPSNRGSGTSTAAPTADVPTTWATGGPITPPTTTGSPWTGTAPPD